MSFIDKLLNDISDSKYLNVPQRVPSVHYYGTSCGSNDPIRSLWKQYENRFYLFEFGTSASVIRSRIIKYLNTM